MVKAYCVGTNFVILVVGRRLKRDMNNYINAFPEIVFTHVKASFPKKPSRPPMRQGKKSPRFAPMFSQPIPKVDPKLARDKAPRSGAVEKCPFLTCKLADSSNILSDIVRLYTNEPYYLALSGF